MSLAYPLQSCLNAYFLARSGQSVRWDACDVLLNLGVLGATGVIVGTFRYGALHGDMEEAVAVAQCLGPCELESAAFAVLNASVWLRVLYLMRLNHVLGPLVKMVAQLTVEILKFVLLLVLVIFTFASVAKIEF